MYSNKNLDGTSQHLSQYTNNSYREYVPFKEHDVTNIEITHNKHDVNMINQNFLNVTARVGLRTRTDQPVEYIEYNNGTTRDLINADEAARRTGAGIQNYTAASFGRAYTVPRAALGNSLYIGWKNSAECVTQIQAFNRGNDTGYMQIYADREAFLENTKYTSKTAKDIHRDCHFDFKTYKDALVNNDTFMAFPGVIVPESTYAHKDILAEETISRAFQSTFVDKDVYFFTAATAQHFGGAGWGGNQTHTLSDQQFEELIHLMGSPNYREYTDFAFNYHMKLFVDAAAGPPAPGAPPLPLDHFQTDDGAGHIVQYDTWQACAIAKHGAPALNMFYDPQPGYKATEVYITKRVYGWDIESPLYVDIPLIVPIKDFAAFRSMDTFEKVFGDITLRLMFGSRSMIYVMNNIMPKQLTNLFDVHNFQITHLSCDCFGYNVDQEELNSVNQIFQDRSRIYETRFTDFKNYDSNLLGGKFGIEFPYPLRCVKDIHLTFPYNTYDMTVFRNPMLKNVQLKLDGVLYPRNDNLRFDDRRFYHLQVKDFEVEDDVKFSFTCRQYDAAGAVITENNKPFDDTNFIATWTLAVGSFFGVNTLDTNIAIHFIGEINRKVANFYGCDNLAAYKDDLPSPQIWFTRDSCWRLNSNNGLTFSKDTTPADELYKDDSDIRYIA